MASLPTPGGSNNTWGAELNTWLDTDHDADGTNTAHASRHKAAGTDPIQLDELKNPTAAVSLNAQKITGLGTPTNATDAATKAYADSVATGLTFKTACRAATTANITLSGEQTIDGVAVVATERVLVKNQSTGANNGIYVCAAGAWSRSSDADESAEVVAGVFVFITEGTTQAETSWVLATNNPITLGSTSLTFAQFAGGTGSGIAATIVDAKGDLIAATAADTVARFAAGTNGYKLVSNSAQTAGLQWVVPDINMPGFRSVAAYGAVVNDSGSAAANTTAVANAQAALAADGGGILFFPPGTWYLSGGISMGTNTHWMGCGRDVSVIAFATDLGADTYAVASNSQTSSYNKMSNLKMYGPAVSFTIGTNPCNMSGLKAGRHFVIEDVFVTNFSSGVAMWADHITIHRLETQNCYKGIDYIDSAARGDHGIFNTILGGNMLCGVYVGVSNCMDHSLYQQVHVVSSPFGFLRTGNASASFMNNSQFRELAFENVGGCAFADYATSGARSWDNCVIDGTGYLQNDSYRYSGADPVAGACDYAIYLPGAGQYNYIRNDFYPFAARSGGSAISAYSLSFAEGTVLVEGGAAGANLNFTHPGGYYRTTEGLELVYYIASGTISLGDIVEETTGTYKTCRRATGVPGAKPIIGVAQNATTNNGGVLVSMYQNTPWGSVLSETVSAAGIALAQKTGTYNVLGLASNYPANPVMGVSMASGGNSGATATVQVRRTVAANPPAASATYAATNVTTDRTYDANATSTDELADILGTLIADLRARGVVL